MKTVAFFAKTLARFDPAPITPDPALRPVVLVHGIFSTGDDMERLARHFRAQGRRVIQPTLLPNGGHAPLEQLALLLSETIDKEFGSQPVDLVGFSMGGLLSRYYLQRLGGIARTGRFVTMATPHNGTCTARLGNAPALVQMRPGSEFLLDLARDADSLRRVQFTSFYTPLDTIIVPARSSEMPQARNIRMWGLIHPSFILESRCIRAIAQALRD